MSGTTISGTYFSTVTLSNAGTQNPATIASGATISSSGIGLFAATAAYWGIANEGVIHGSTGISLQSNGSVANYSSGRVVGTSNGIVLGSGGAVVNYSGGYILGGTYGIEIIGRTGLVVNYGTVFGSHIGAGGTGIYLKAGGEVINGSSQSIKGGTYGVVFAGAAGKLTNSGDISAGVSSVAGVVLRAGGSVTNNASGSITGKKYGVYITGAAGTVINSGSIAATAATGQAGVLLSHGGSVTNNFGGSIEGSYNGVEISGGTGTIVNLGAVTGTDNVGVYLEAGGSITNFAFASITGGKYGVEITGGAETLSNRGSITDSNTASGAGVYLTAGGFVTNAASASITGGQYGVKIGGDAGTLSNHGSVTDSNTASGAGVALKDGGSVTNFASASITGAKFGIEVLTSTGVVLNSGIINSSLNTSATSGIYLQNGGSVTNTASGSISGGRDGIDIAGGSGSVVNSGTIAGVLEGVVIAGVGYVSNAVGALINSGAIGIDLGSGGTVTNAGTISGNGAKAIAFYGTDASRVVVDPGAVFKGKVIASSGIGATNASFANFGTVVVDSGANWELTGSNTLAAGSTLTNKGTLTLFKGSLSDSGGLVANNGTLDFNGNTANIGSLNGTGSVTLAANSTLTVQDLVSSGQDIDFNGNDFLNLATALDFAGTISGFHKGDRIDLTAVANVAGSHADMNTTTNVLTVTEGGTAYQFQFDKTESFAGDFFHLASLNGGTVITEDEVACYCRGTLIATGSGEVPVEELSIGDEIMTASGKLRPIKWIGRRSYGGRFVMGRRDILPVCFKAGSLADGLPRRDLWISPHHAMYLDGVLIEARDLVNGVSIVQADEVESVEYFHVELDSHDVILAEGAASETFVDDDSRGMFHNAREYALLYPAEAARPARYCAPRLDEGFEVEAIRRHLAQRAGLAPDGPLATPDPLRGYVDAVSTAAIEGWAQNAGCPEAAVCLDVYADGRLIGRTLANLHREDLKDARLGSGRHAFVFTPPEGVVASAAAIEVRRSLDGARLARGRN